MIGRLKKRSFCVSNKCQNHSRPTKIGANPSASGSQTVFVHVCFQKENPQFNKALQRMPRRTKSLLGKMTALKALNLQEEAELVQNELKSILAQADNKVLSMI